jgi:hypothetical protein
MPMDCLQRQSVRIVAAYADELSLDETPSSYATNRQDWEANRVLMTYLDRWPIETFSENAKACLGLGFEDYQLCNLRDIKRHWSLSFAAYSLLGGQGPPGRSRWAVRGRFESTGQRCRAVVDALLGHLVHWIVQQIDMQHSPNTVLQMLLA